MKFALTILLAATAAPVAQEHGERAAPAGEHAPAAQSADHAADRAVSGTPAAAEASRDAEPATDTHETPRAARDSEAPGKDPAAARPTARRTNKVDVRVATIGEDVFYSVRARAVPANEILRTLAEESSRDIVGLEGLGELDPVDVDLVERPLDVVVDWVAGAAGLRAQVKLKAIAVRKDLGETARPADLHDMADVMYVRALNRYPDAVQADEAELHLARIQEGRGNLAAARQHFDVIPLRHPDSPLVVESLLRTARIQMTLEEWKDAATRWSKLANRPEPNKYLVEARVEMARCLALSPDDAKLALSIIDSVDELYPATTTPEIADRSYVRAAALVGQGRGNEAMTALEKGMSLGLGQAASLDALRVRAAALDLVKRPGEAARAWLAFATECSDKVREDAYLRAATSAENAKDYLGVLFIERSAKVVGADTRLRPIADRARVALGLSEAPLEAPTERLTRAEHAYELGEYVEAAQFVDSALLDRDRLDEADLVRALVVRARCTEIARGLAPAIEQVKSALGDVRRPENRKRLYLLAGELYTKHEQWELAAGAYGGRL